MRIRDTHLRYGKSVYLDTPVGSYGKIYQLHKDMPDRIFYLGPFISTEMSIPEDYVHVDTLKLSRLERALWGLDES